MGALHHHQFSLTTYSLNPLISKQPHSEVLILKTIIHSQSPPIISISTPTNTTTYTATFPVLHCSTTSFDSSVEKDEPQSTRVFIKGLAQSVGEGFLLKTFSRFGHINQVKIVMDRKGLQSLGLAYVWFSKEDSAESAVKEMNGKFFCGRFIIVTIAKPESPTSQRKFTPYKF